MTAALEGGEWSAAHPGCTLLLGKTPYAFYRRLGGPQGWSERAEDLVRNGIRSWTVQSVAQSLYRLSYPAHTNKKYAYNINTWNANDSSIMLLQEEAWQCEIHIFWQAIWSNFCDLHVKSLLCCVTVLWLAWHISTCIAIQSTHVSSQSNSGKVVAMVEH